MARGAEIAAELAAAGLAILVGDAIFGARRPAEPVVHIRGPTVITDESIVVASAPSTAGPEAEAQHEYETRDDVGDQPIFHVSLPSR